MKSKIVLYILCTHKYILDTDVLVELGMAAPVLTQVISVDPRYVTLSKDISSNLYFVFRVVHQLCPEKFRLELSNKAGTLNGLVSLVPIKTGYLAALCGGKVFLLQLHNPVKISLLSTAEVSPSTSQLLSSEGILMFFQGMYIYFEGSLHKK